MGLFGKSKSTTQQYSTQSSGPPQWVQGEGQSIYDQAKQLVADRPNYQSYGGQAIADYGQTWQTALDSIKGLLSSPDSSYGKASSILDQLRGTVNPNATIADYMNPYTDSVLTPQLRAIQEAGVKARQGLSSAAVGSGAYGDARQGIEEALQYRNEQQNVADTTGKAYNDAFNYATNARNADLARLLGISQSEQSLGGSQSALAQILAQMGDKERTVDQAKDAYNVQEFQKGQQYPYQNLAFLQSILKGTPVETTSSGNSTSTTTQPNNTGYQLLGQLLGSALSFPIPGAGGMFSGAGNGVVSLGGGQLGW